ncbi:kinase-like domain-containing protein [Leptodontidium sp. MPI-SDFR-AT-0119]|nr:kinase-like domain-containing protein [Leptodontidium sp. MPI-SDFR-AT-0119]
MASSVIGKSGRVYVQDKVLQRQWEEKSNILRAESENEFFVLKPVRRPFYELSRTLAAEFAGSRRLRMHIDCNEIEDILVYPYFRDTLLGIIQNDPDFPTTERKKFYNVDVVLGDFDIAFKSEGGKARETPHAIGNAMWRSPEGQTGKGVTKASDIFSFGLVCIYTLSGGEFLLLNDYKELVKQGISAEQEILTRHFIYFGPVPEGLYKQVNDKNWCEAMKESSEIADLAAKDQPELRFTSWSQELGSAAQDMIYWMTNLDPAHRTTIDHVLSHRWWQDRE